MNHYKFKANTRNTGLPDKRFSGYRSYIGIDLTCPLKADKTVVIAFDPSTGRFSRVKKPFPWREFILAAILVPFVWFVCFIWLALGEYINLIHNV